jgi:methylenetetrahydrofolate dehydrogenase (NADP+) / methenyltetrahydrofolate cyclohydrolase
MASFEHKLDADTSEAELLALIARLNADPAVHGILVQLPLPGHMNADLVINAIDPAKDVDGFHISNVGLLGTGQKAMVPCTPLGCLMMLREPSREPFGDGGGGDRAVEHRGQADGAASAGRQLHGDGRAFADEGPAGRGAARRYRRGRGGAARDGAGDWIKPGATVIDVGINRIDGDGQARGWWAMWISQLRGGGGRDHAGAGRRGADDHRLPAGQHGHGLLPGEWGCPSPRG